MTGREAELLKEAVRIIRDLRIELVEVNGWSYITDKAEKFLEKVGE